MRVIYVDDEQPALDNFRFTVAGFQEIEELQLFQSGEEAIQYASSHIVDVAFLDIEMPGLHGIILAQKLQEINQNIRVIFVTAFSQYAMEAWDADAVGYVLKPYTAEEIQKELRKCGYKPLPSQQVVIQTIPTLAIFVNGKAVQISGNKVREMFALLVDHGEQGITAGEGIAYLWPEREENVNTKSLFRMTYKRMTNALKEAGIGHIVASYGNRRYICMDQVDCDLYRIFAGDPYAIRKYAGQYLREYSWAEERNGQLYHLAFAKEPK